MKIKVVCEIYGKLEIFGLEKLTRERRARVVKWLRMQADIFEDETNYFEGKRNNFGGSVYTARLGKRMHRDRFRQLRVVQALAKHGATRAAHHMANLTVLAGVMLLGSGCAELKPSWQGLWVGAQVVAPFNESPRREDLTGEATAIWGFGAKNSFQLGVWGNPDAYGYRIAIERKMF